ncbi:hypothetical protein CLAIMM_13017 [Cladophialophora immunda]|nr:hypothetical protein CLAIMM_13017 [Cladophialophora immunda]
MPMYCLRSYLPLLLLPLPLSLSPIHLILLLVLTYLLNRPCIYCSFLLIILFASSCHWSNRCFIDLPILTSQHPDGGELSSYETIAAWFTPRLYTTDFSGNLGNMTGQASNGAAASEMGGFLTDVARTTVAGLANAAKNTAEELFDEARQKLVVSSTTTGAETAASATSLPSLLDTGIGTHWLRNLLGRSEWTLPCVGVKLVL